MEGLAWAFWASVCQKSSRSGVYYRCCLRINSTRKKAMEASMSDAAPTCAGAWLRPELPDSKAESGRSRRRNSD
jgi:hypothetical protein